MKKKALSLLLVLTMLLAMVPTAFAAAADEEGYLAGTGTGTSEAAIYKNSTGNQVTVKEVNDGGNKKVYIVAYADGKAPAGITGVDFDYGTVTDTYYTDGGDTITKDTDFVLADGANKEATVTFPSGANGTWHIWYKHDQASSAGTHDVSLKNGVIEVPQCEITWDLNYTGAPTATKGQQDQGATVTLPTAPTRAGYKFNGWFDAATSGNQITGASTVPAAVSATYYAQWTEKTAPTAPTGLTAVTYKHGLAMSDITLPKTDSNAVTWTWDNGQTPTVGTKYYKASAVETADYKAASAQDVEVTVNKGAITVAGAAQGRIGKTLADSGIVLTDVVTVKDTNNNTYTLTPESIAWVDDTATITAGEQNVQVNVTLKTTDSDLYTVAGPYTIKVTGQDKNPTNFTGVKDLSGKVGDTVELSITASSGKAVTFESNKPDIVKVEGNKLTYLAEGEATITAKVEGDADWAANTATFKVTVASAADPHAAFMFGTTADGKTFEPDRGMTRAEVAVMIANLDGYDKNVNYAALLAKVPADLLAEKANLEKWTDNGYNKLCYILNEGIMQGRDDGNFHPYDTITRQEMAIVLGKYLPIAPATGADQFNDLTGSAVYAEGKGYINALKAAGKIDGFPDGGYHPTENLTRAQAAKMMNYAMDREPDIAKMKAANVTTNFDDVKTFAGNSQAEWALYNIIEASQNHEVADFH